MTGKGGDTTTDNSRKGTVAAEDEEDDLDLLIHDIQDSNVRRKIPLHQQYKVSNECYPVFIGGANLEGGITLSSIQPRSCERLKCNDCEKRVIRFPNYKWKPMIDSTFLATQSFNPLNLQKVKLLHSIY